MVMLVGGARPPAQAGGVQTAPPPPPRAGACARQTTLPPTGVAPSGRGAPRSEPRFRHPPKGPLPTGVMWPSSRFRGHFSERGSRSEVWRAAPADRLRPDMATMLSPYPSGGQS